MKAAQIVAYAREALGTPYSHQGRLNGVALDCAGVASYVGKRMDLAFADKTTYGKLPVPAEMRSALDKNLNRVRKEDMQIGDVVWIKFNEEPQHLAIVGDYPLGGFSLIHAYNSAGLNSVVEHRMDEAWLKKIVAVWRYPGIEL